MASRRAPARTREPAAAEAKQPANVAEIAARLFEDLGADRYNSDDFETASQFHTDFYEVISALCGWAEDQTRVPRSSLVASMNPETELTLHILPARELHRRAFNAAVSILSPSEVPALMEGVSRLYYERFGNYCQIKYGEGDGQALCYRPARQDFPQGTALVHAAPTTDTIYLGPDQGAEFFAKFAGSAAPARAIQLAEAPKTDEQRMAQGDSIVIRGGVLLKGGLPYRSLPVAARLGQAPRQTLRDWIKNKTEFQGHPLQSYYLEPLDRYFVSEESIERMANRFVKWRDKKPAGAAGHVTIGKTKDRSGFLPTSAAAHILGVSPRTMWLWASEGNAPKDTTLDVIKCTTSDHFYIREKDVHDLRKIIPRSGLQRGRRPQSAQP